MTHITIDKEIPIMIMIDMIPTSKTTLHEHHRITTGML